MIGRESVASVGALTRLLLQSKHRQRSIDCQHRISPCPSGPHDEAAPGVIRSEAEQGIALIAVLWMLVLLSVVAAALALEAHSSTRIASNLAEKAAARAAADAGVQRAILDLQTPIVAKGQKFRADGTVYEWRFGKSIVRITIRAEANKVDLIKLQSPS